MQHVITPVVTTIAWHKNAPKCTKSHVKILIFSGIVKHLRPTLYSQIYGNHCRIHSGAGISFQGGPCQSRASHVSRRGRDADIFKHQKHLSVPSRFPASTARTQDGRAVSTGHWHTEQFPCLCITGFRTTWFFLKAQPVQFFGGFYWVLGFIGFSHFFIWALWKPVCWFSSSVKLLFRFASSLDYLKICKSITCWSLEAVNLKKSLIITSMTNWNWIKFGVGFLLVFLQLVLTRILPGCLNACVLFFVALSLLVRWRDGIWHVWLVLLQPLPEKFTLA